MIGKFFIPKGFRLSQRTLDRIKRRKFDRLLFSAPVPNILVPIENNEMTSLPIISMKKYTKR